MVEAFPEERAPRFILRDRDQIDGEDLWRRVAGMQIEEVLISARCPWQNPYVERLIGSIRSECLDHVIILNEGHVRRIRREYLAYYHESRRHQSVERNSPMAREVEPSGEGQVISLPVLGRLHHRYRRAA